MLISNKKVFIRSVIFIIIYKRLWKLLIDRDMKKPELQHGAKISSSTMMKLNKGENVSTAVLSRICNFLDCDVADIMEVKPDSDDL